MKRAMMLGIVAGMCCSTVFAQTAGMLNFQGFLRDQNGIPIDGTVALQFRIFDAEVAGILVDINCDGSVDDVVGLDVVEVLDVAIAVGIVTQKFGPICPASFDGSQRWLEVTVDGLALDRFELATAPATAEQINIPGTGNGAIFIDGSGNVGIGTANPGAALDVNGSVSVSGTVDGVDISSHASNANAHHTPTVDTFVTNKDAHDHAGGDGAQIQHSSLGSVTANQHHTPPTSLPPSGSATGDLQGSYPGPQVTNDSHSHTNGTISDNISINNGRLFAPSGSGNVGIGTTSPSFKLHVNGTTYVQGVTSNPNNTGSLRIDGFDNQLMFDHTGSNSASRKASIVYNNFDNLPQVEGGITFQRRSNSGVFQKNLVSIRGDNGWVSIAKLIGDLAAQYPLQVGTSGDGANGNGAHCTTGGIWTNGSDRSTKQKFESIDKRDVLRRVIDLPVTQWQYKGEADGIRHIGPMAQDFHAAFGLGASDKHIGTLDSEGVALAAIQGLHEIVQEKEAEIEALKKRLAAIEARLDGAHDLGKAGAR